MQRILLAIAVLFLLMTPVVAESTEINENIKLDVKNATELSMNTVTKLVDDACNAVIIISSDATKSARALIDLADTAKIALKEAQKNGDENAVKAYEIVILHSENAVKSILQACDSASEAARLAKQAAGQTKLTDVAANDALLNNCSA